MVSPRLRKHANDLLYLLKAKPCISKQIIAKADRSLVECLCECADKILRGNIQFTQAQKTKFRRIKAGLRTLVKKAISLQKKKTVLQRGGFM
jgi:hypothetical protein